MTTIRQIITDAFREGGLVQVGLTPDADEFSEALRKLQVLIPSLIGNELGNPLTSVSYGSAGLDNAFAKAQDISSAVDRTFIPLNCRIVFNIDAPTTLYLPPNPEDGSRFGVIDNKDNFATHNVTINGNGRQIESAATAVLSTNGLAREWFYRADLGEWVRVSEVTADSENPFPEEFTDFLVTLLAIRLNPRYQEQTLPETLDAFQRMRRQFRARYRPSVQIPTEYALLMLTNYDNLYSNSVSYADVRFNRGG